MGGPACSGPNVVNPRCPFNNKNYGETYETCQRQLETGGSGESQRTCVQYFEYKPLERYYIRVVLFLCE